MRLSTIRLTVAAAFAGGSSVACANTAPDDELLPSQLDRLRVLAIAAEPADLVPGESATVGALVFEPNAQPVDYAWSWCPVRIDVENGPSCPIDEGLWAELWRSAGLEGAPAAYDLGSEPSAVLRPAFEAESARRLCDAAGTLGPAAEPARVACVDGFEANLVLRARAAGAEEIAIKRVPLLPAAVPPQARNRNPGPLGAVSVRAAGSDEAPVSNGTLYAAREYALHAELTEELSEVLPEAAIASTLGKEASGDQTVSEPTEEARETLVLSWFVTPGELSDPDDDETSFGPFDNDSQRTVYVPGQSPFASLLDNGWNVPSGDRASAELILVLRDGRDGVAWLRNEFVLVSETP